MTKMLRTLPAARVVARVGLGMTLTAGVVALSMPAGLGSMALALGAGGLVALSGLSGGKRHRARVTAPRRA